MTSDNEIISTDNLDNDKTFFELLRVIEKKQNQYPRLGSQEDYSIKRLNIVQSADMSFAGGEVYDVKQNGNYFSIKIRHFGMFAPYGPLPIHITEHARNEILFKRNESFVKFVNIISQRFSILHYRAWSQLNYIVGCDHNDDKNPFLIHLQQISGINKKLNDNIHIKRIRQFFPGLYLLNSKSLKNLNKVLSFYFKDPIKISPRHAKWIDDGKKYEIQKLGFLGKTRIGSRFFDAQYSAHIQIGPLSSPFYEKYQKGSEKLIQMINICNDFVNNQILFDVTLIIKTETGMSAKLGQNFLSKDGWLKPGDGIYEQLVYQSTT